jgi:hypothetical protein
VLGHLDFVVVSRSGFRVSIFGVNGITAHNAVLTDCKVLYLQNGHILNRFRNGNIL